MLESGRKMGLEFCLTIGTQMGMNGNILKQVQQHKQVFGTLGVHPHNAKEFDRSTYDLLKEAINSSSKIVAVGECGYDFHYHHSSVEDQEFAFEKQLDLALELSLPVVIHTREAEQKTIDTLDKYRSKGLKGVFHSFTSSLALAEYALDAGFYISFNGIATFPKSELVREVLKMVPIEKILLETDAPFLSPVPVRGRTNVPGNVGIIGTHLAEFLGIPAKEFAIQTKLNTLTLFSQITYEC